MRKKLHLIHGQPLLLVERKATPASAHLKKKKNRGSNIGSGPHSQKSALQSSQKPTTSKVFHQSDNAELSPPRTGPRKHSLLPTKSPQNSAFQSEGVLEGSSTTTHRGPLPHPLDFPMQSLHRPSKRASSPFAAQESSKQKRAKPTFTSSCVICGLSPHHLAKDCSVVAHGPKRYAWKLCY